MSRGHSAILDDESDRGLRRVKKYSRGEGDNLRFVVGVGKEMFYSSFPTPPHSRPLAPTPLCSQNGGLVVETILLEAFAVTKTLALQAAFSAVIFGMSHNAL